MNARCINGTGKCMQMEGIMSHFDKEALVERIRCVCKEKGVSIAQMEKDFDWSQGVISRWTKNSPSIDKVMEVIHYLKVDYVTILGELEFLDQGQEDVKEISEKLFDETEAGRIEWELCKKDFKHKEIQSFLKQNEKCKVYAALYDKVYFLLILNREEVGTMDMGVVRGTSGKIRFIEQKTDKWMEKLLELIDLDEYDIWDEAKTEYYINQFMQG